MNGIVITENGIKQVVTDVGPYLVERDRVVGRLADIYHGFDEQSVDALGPREAEIVELLNRHDFLRHVIESFEQAKIRQANILAGWDVVKLHRAEPPG